jgi:SAM-dependent methyltransferase
LNVAWLRPESALWDAIASRIISTQKISSPSLDLGCGNGIFSFITAGGRCSPEYDWYRSAQTAGFWENRDIYDAFDGATNDEVVLREPDYLVDVGLDVKRNLLCQAAELHFYRQLAVADANAALPFRSSSFQSVFSNVLYWLRSPEFSFREIHRVLRPSGRALLCLMDRSFPDVALTYKWRETGSNLLRLLNRGREQSVAWTIHGDEIHRLATMVGFEVVNHARYISPLTLRVWDIGLRPVSPVLINVSRKLSPADRAQFKAEWVGTLKPFLDELFALEERGPMDGVFHFVCLERK